MSGQGRPSGGSSLIVAIATLWLLNVVVDAGGQLAFKRAAMLAPPGDRGLLGCRMTRLRAPWIGVGILCYAIEFPLWLGFLSLVPLSRGVLLGSISIVVLALAGRWLFRESLGRWRVTGIALIAVGVGVVGLDAQ